MHARGYAGLFTVGVARTVFALHLAPLLVIVLFVAAVGGSGGRRLRRGLRLGLRGRPPARDLPDDTGEGLEPEAALGPFTARGT